MFPRTAVVLENIRPQKQKYVNHGIDVVVEITKSLGCFKIFVRIDDAVIHGTTAVTSFEYTDSPLPSMAVDTYKYGFLSQKCNWS